MRSARTVARGVVVSQRQAAASASGRAWRTRWPAWSLCVLAAGAWLSAGVTRAQEPAYAGGLTSTTLPGGLRASLAAIGDPMTPDRSLFLLELIRRSHRTPIGANDPHDPVIKSLISHLDVAEREGEGPAGALETLPLPLPPSVWIEAVFGGRVTPPNLTRAIVGSRNASLLYFGLFALDDPTRAWLAGHPGFVAELSAKYPAVFVLAAPGLRIANGAIQVPGGPLAVTSWESLVGRPVTQPVDFVRALLTESEGTLAYFFGALAQLSPAQVHVALNLDVDDAVARVGSARRLHAVFARISAGWSVDTRTFWRPALDPALLVSDLPLDDAGRPRLPGTRGFWEAAFAEEARRRTVKPDARMATDPETALDFSWLADRIFQGEAFEHRRRYHQVLFASRVLSRTATAGDRDAVDAVRAAGSFPALIAALERMRLTDLSVYARAVRRAARWSEIADDARALRAMTQFQGLLALVARAAARGSVPADSLASHVTSLADVDFDERGDYAGRLVRWIDEHLRGANASTSEERPVAFDGVDVAGPVEGDVLRMLAGPPDPEPRVVEWEGTRYRVDLSRAETLRLARLLGDEPRPYLSSAGVLVVAADRLADPGVTRERLTAEADAIERVGERVGWGAGGNWEGSDAVARYQAVVGPLRRLKNGGPVNGASRFAPALRELADDLAARGVLELTYAAALGQPDRAWVAAGDSAWRHDFGLRTGGVRRRGAPWRLPSAGGDTMRGWRVVGSLLGLDVRLAEFSLMRLSSKPPPRRPSLNEDQRRVFVESVALIEARRLTDEDRDAIVSAMRAGQARLAALRTPADAAAIAEAVGLGPARRSLLPWLLENDSERVASFLSPSELFRLGRGNGRLEARFQAWGAPGESRLGCLCLQLLDRRPWETLAGRWGTGILASGFPDLNLRLAEVLAELRMPAALLGPVLASATLDFINTSVSRDQDDRRGLVEFVRSLDQARVEQYLALLTTGGPLVPVAAEGSGSTTDAPPKAVRTMSPPTVASEVRVSP